MIPYKAKKIGLVTATAFAVGAMIGGGVFILTGVALKQAGPSALISFGVAGAIVLLSALSFAVVASQASAKESGYVYVGTLLGPIWGFLTSWCFYLGGIIGAAFVLSAFGVYMNEFVASGVPALTWAVGAAVVLTIVNLGPASEIGKIETFLVGGKLLILGVLIVAGLTHIHASDLQPFVAHGGGAILATSASLFIAFLGFNVITSISGDIDTPRKTVPRAILLSMLIVTVVYIGVVIALLASHITNYSGGSVGVAAQHLIGPVGGGLVIIGALIATLSAANANILGSSEIMVRLAARKDVPTVLGMLYRGHPFVSVLIGAVCYILLMFVGKLELIINLANITAITALMIVNIAAVRALQSKKHHGLRLPFGYLLPILGTLGAAWQFMYIPVLTSVLGVSLVGAGAGIYAVRKHFFVAHAHRQIAQTVHDVDGPLSRSLKR